MTSAERDDLLIRIDERTSELHKAVFGNGRAGLVDRVQTVEQALLWAQERYDNCPARSRNWLGIAAIVLAAVSSLAAWVAALK